MCEFIGLVNYYQDMWGKSLHILQPLTRLTSKEVKFKRNDAETKVFDKVKQIVVHNNLLDYPHFNKQIDIHMDYTDLYLGAVIRQEDRLMEFYSRKLTNLQARYTVME